jgi:hypothetical protein
MGFSLAFFFFPAFCSFLNSKVIDSELKKLVYEREKWMNSWDWCWTDNMRENVWEDSILYDSLVPSKLLVKLCWTPKADDVYYLTYL